MNTGVILLNMGGPDELGEIRQYLENIFLDPDIIDLPFGSLFRSRLARFIAKKRAPKSIERYKQIGGASPLNSISKKQVSMLQKALIAKGFYARVGLGMRYWKPFTRQTLEKWSQTDVNNIIALPMYPHYCRATSGSSLREFRKDVKTYLPEASVTEIKSWHDYKPYIEFIARQIFVYLSQYTTDQLQSLCVLFSAHNVPVKLIKAGDPYKDQIEQTVQLIDERLPSNIKSVLGYQSSFGPMKWLSPDSKDLVEQLYRSGIRHLIIVPMGFVAENIETVWDMDLDLIPHAKRLGMETIHRLACPNVYPIFIEGLAQLVLQKHSGESDVN